MTTLEDIENAIRALPQPDFESLRDWMAEYDAQLWDRQFEDDVLAGRLDALAEEALDDLREGRHRRRIIGPSAESPRRAPGR